MGERPCAWCMRWHHPEIRTVGDDLCDLNLAMTRLVVIVRRPLVRLLARMGI